MWTNSGILYKKFLYRHFIRVHVPKIYILSLKSNMILGKVGPRDGAMAKVGGAMAPPSFYITQLDTLHNIHLSINPQKHLGNWHPHNL